MSPIFTIPATATADLLAYVGQIFTDAMPFAVLAIGIPLGFYVISRAIGLVRGRTRK